ncbi:MAG: hypothetical protein Q7J98_10460 [Kiritimatiellia bacterium]|nr:hypothetical protein [Kiritimatiellia bacterium]
MKHRFDLIALTAAMMFVFPAGANIWALNISRPRSSDTVLVVPARPGILRLAFDLAGMRSVTIVSFRGKANAGEPLLHVWEGKKWQYVSFDDFCSLRFVDQPPKTAIIIGDDQTVPKALLQGMNWPCKIERLPTINAADLINGMDPYCQFSSREWKRLAKSYSLKLEDVNAPKRDFNPYNIPRSKLPLETRDFRQGKDDAPPAVLIEKK